MQDVSETVLWKTFVKNFAKIFPVFSLTLPDILLHPFLQLFGDLLFLPLFEICNKHSGVERTVAGVDAQVFDFLFSIVQEAHVCGLKNELRYI